MRARAADPFLPLVPILLALLLAASAAGAAAVQAQDLPQPDPLQPFRDDPPVQPPAPAQPVPRKAETPRQVALRDVLERGTDAQRQVEHDKLAKEGPAALWALPVLLDRVRRDSNMKLPADYAQALDAIAAIGPTAAPDAAAELAQQMMMPLDLQMESAVAASQHYLRTLQRLGEAGCAAVARAIELNSFDAIRMLFDGFEDATPRLRVTILRVAACDRRLSIRQAAQAVLLGKPIRDHDWAADPEDERDNMHSVPAVVRDLLRREPLAATQLLVEFVDNLPDVYWRLPETEKLLREQAARLLTEPLGQTLPPEAMRPLMPWLAGDDTHRALAARALGRFGEGGRPHVIRAFRCDPCWAVREAALAALQQIGCDLDELAPQLGAMIADPGDPLRRNAADALMRIDVGRAVAALVALLGRETDPDGRGLAMRLLARIGEPAMPALIAIIAALRADSTAAAADAATVLVFIGAPAVSPLCNLLTGDDVAATVLLRAIRVLGRIGPPAASAAGQLRALTAHADPAVAAAASSALEALQDQR